MIFFMTTISTAKIGMLMTSWSCSNYKGCSQSKSVTQGGTSRACKHDQLTSPLTPGRMEKNINIQGVWGTVNILGGGSMDYSEYISSYKHVSNFQLVWRYSCLNVTHRKPYKRHEGKTNILFIAFTGYVNDLNKLQQFKVSVQQSHHRLQCTFQLSWQQYM
jgi:hypothetical protein